MRVRVAPTPSRSSARALAARCRAADRSRHRRLHRRRPSTSGRSAEILRAVDDVNATLITDRDVNQSIYCYKAARRLGYTVRQIIRKPFTRTHPFNGPLSVTTQVSRYQKGKTNLDFTEARDSEWQWHQLGQMQVCTSLQTDNRASTPPLSFYRPDALPAAQPTASKHRRYIHTVNCLKNNK